MKPAMKKKKLMPQKQYVKEAGYRCPVCHSVASSGNDEHSDGYSIWVSCYCPTCKSTWVEIYALHGYCDLIVKNG